MSEGSYYIQQVEEPERFNTKRSLGVVGICVLLLGLCAAVFASPLLRSQSTSASAVDMPATQMTKTGLQTRQLPGPIPHNFMTRDAAFLGASAKPWRQESSSELPRSRGAVAVPRAHFVDKDITFNYKSDVDFAYDEIPASDLQDMLDKGWVLLDVRNAEQVARAKVQGAVEVPAYVVSNDTSPFGLYQEAIAFGLGGWWAGTRAMKENPDFVPQVMQATAFKAPFPGIIAGCQTGLRSKQALKQLHLAGFKPRLALIKGGFDRVKSGELCSQDECIVPQGAKIQLAGSGNIAGMLGWHHT